MYHVIMRRIVINQYIIADPQICHGKPTFKGTRIMIWQVLEMLKEGIDEKGIFEAFPHLTKNHIRSALEYAASLTKEGYAIINTQP